MARLLALCTLPRTNPGDRTQYKRVNGPYTLIMSCSGAVKLPYGTLPRLLLAWICTEAVADAIADADARRVALDVYAEVGHRSVWWWETR